MDVVGRIVEINVGAEFDLYLSDGWFFVFYRLSVVGLYFDVKFDGIVDLE